MAIGTRVLKIHIVSHFSMINDIIPSKKIRLRKRFQETYLKFCTSAITITMSSRQYFFMFIFQVFRSQVPSECYDTIFHTRRGLHGLNKTPI